MNENPTIIEDLMTSEPITIEPGDKVGRARDLMLTLGIHALPVVREDVVVGIVTSTDLIDNWPDDEAVSTVMTSAPYSIDIETGLREAADLMIERRVHHLLVERHGHTVGILSSLDLLYTLVVRPGH